MKTLMKRTWLKTIFGISSFCTRLYIKLVRFTGKAPYEMHPKHLVDDAENHWFLKYIQPNDIVLDIGCGNGMHALHTAKRCNKVIGVELNEKDNQFALTEARKQHINNVEFYCASLYDFLKASYDESYDIVLLLDVLEHLNERDTALKDIHRILKPGGKLLLAIPNAETTWKKRLKASDLPYFSCADHKIEYTQQSILEELNRNRFAIDEDFKTIVYDSPLKGFIDLIGGISVRIYKKLLNWNRKKVQTHKEESIGWRIVARKG